MRTQFTEKCISLARLVITMVLVASMLVSTVVAVPMEARLAQTAAAALQTEEGGETAPEESTDAEPQPDPAEGPQEEAEDPQPDAEEPRETEAPQETPPADEQAPAAPAGTARTLTRTVTTDGDAAYTFTVAYGPDAGVPADATLSVTALSQAPVRLDGEDPRPRDGQKFLTEAEMTELKDDLAEGLDVEKEGYIFSSDFFDISLNYNGRKVKLLAPVSVTVEAKNLDPAAAAAMEIASLDGKNKWQTLSVTDESDKEAARLTVSTDQLTRIALAGVVAPLQTWTVRGLELSVLGPRSLSPQAVEAQPVQLDSKAICAYDLRAADGPDYGTALWLTCRPALPGVGALPGMLGCRLSEDGEKEPLFAARGTTVPVELRAGDRVALLWSGEYRAMTLEEEGVTLAGVLPADARAETADVLADYSSLSIPSDRGEELTALAAYDISITSDGKVYEPTENLPVTVTIDAGRPVSAASAEVLHILDDGTVEVIRDVAVDGSEVTFQAVGFSGYLLAGTPLLGAGEESDSTSDSGNLAREMISLDGSWAYWKVTVNPSGAEMDGGEALTLSDTFDDELKLDAWQSIDYASINVTNADGTKADSVSYDYSGSTGTFVIPDSTPVTITYRTRITSQPGDAHCFRGTAVLKNSNGETIASATAGVTGDPVVIYPSASDVAGMGSEYMVKLFVYGEGAMQQGIEGAQFILLDANQRPLEYKVGENKGDPVTFTTGSDGYVNIELHEEAGDVSIEKNTAYYLEMMKAVEGYQKDNTLYSFMITDDPSYNSGGFYQYYNGDTMKVRLYPARAGLSVSIRFSGSYALREDQQNAVTAVLQMLDDNDQWVEVERHPYTDTQWGSIIFDTSLYNESASYRNFYRVVIENASPWDLPDNIHLETTYYSMVNTESSVPKSEPQEFSVESAKDSVSVVIDNRYEEPQLTITKMDKSTGAVLPGAVFSVYKIVNGEPSGGPVTTYTTDDNGELVIRGGESFKSETLYGITETAAPTDYLLPLKPEWHYFYFCNDEYLEKSILANLPADETAINLTETGDRITLGNQKKTVTIPVMALWQGGEWPENAQVMIGLYQTVDGVTTPVKDDNDKGKPVILTKAAPYNNSAFRNLPSRDEQGRNITYSIKEERINEQAPLDAGYVPEYGVSSAGVYIVRNKPATTLTVSKEWYDFDGNKVEGENLLNQQSPVTFDVYRSSAPFEDKTPADGITNAEMTDFVSGLTKVREGLTFGATNNWSTSINDLDKRDDLGSPYYYYVLETVPSFGNELYEVNDATGAVTIKNKIVPESVNLTVTKAALVDDPREESLDREFAFTLKLKKDETHPIRSWQVYTDEDNTENNLITDWNGEVKFKLKPTNPDNQPTSGASITLNLPEGVTATVTETYNPEYTVQAAANVDGTTGDNGRSFFYETSSENHDVTLTYTNTLRVVCKVVPDGADSTPVPFESLSRALKYIRDNPSSFTSPWTIYLLEDYTIPATDTVEIREGESLTITTALKTDELFPFKPPTGDSDRTSAVITRGGAGGSMLINAGTLTLENICLDGGGITATGDGGLVYSTGILNLNNKTTLRNSATNGKGGAIYAKGTVNLVDGVSITGNSAPSASALYLNGTLNMSGGSITGNTGAADGAVVVGSSDDKINLSGSPVIFDNTNAQGKAANLYIGVGEDNIVEVVSPGLENNAHIGISAMEGHNEIGQQFATAEVGQTEHLNCFINDVYGYHGKLKDGTSTNIVWDGLTLTIKKAVDPVGANSNDRFTITLSSPSIVSSNYIIDGTIDYSISAARPSRPGRITLRNVKAADEITISPLPVGSYTIAEETSNYTPTYTIGETGSSEEPEASADGTFTANNDATITVTNTRRLADVKLTKTLVDRMKTAEETQNFDFTVKLTEADGTKVKNFMLVEGVTTGANGEATFTMSPENNDSGKAIQNFRAPVGATMTITETDDPSYRISASAKTMPSEGEGEAIADEDTDNANIFTFPVTEDGAAVTFANERKMAEIELSKTLVGKVSETESFAFTVTLTRADGNPAAGYTMYEDPEDSENNITTGTEDDMRGKATIPFVFRENESSKSVTLTIPEGTKLEVEETEVKKDVNGTERPIYNTTYSMNGAAARTGLKATIPSVSDTDESIAFTNTRKTQTVTVTNTVSGYSGNVVPFTFTATVKDGDQAQDYDANGFTDGVQTFELATGQSKDLTVPYGATLTVAEGFIVGYDTTVKRGGADAVTATQAEFAVAQNETLAFTNTQLIGLRLVNKTSAPLNDVKVTVGYGTEIYRVNDEQTGQNQINHPGEKNATLSIASGETAILEITHQASATAEQDYTVSGAMPESGYYYTINNEPAYHEHADPAVLRVYDNGPFEVKGKLRYSVSDSTVTFTEQPLVSFDANGGAWTTEMEGYHDRDGDRQVYQKAVDKNTAVAQPSPAPVYPTAEGIAFLGWTADEAFAKSAHTASEDLSGNLYDFDTAVTGPTTLYAVWAKPARDTHVVTVKNGFADDLTVTATLTKNTSPMASYPLAADLSTDNDGKASFTLAANGTRNLTVPNGATLALAVDERHNNALSVSSEFTNTSTVSHSFLIASAERDGTVSFTGGICKITDSDGKILYDGNGKPAVYPTLAAAFTAYNGALYTDATHSTEATPAAVKMLIDEYAMKETTAIAFPNATMTLTTAGKSDTDFPYVGARDRSAIYRSSTGANQKCFTLASGNVTLTNIVLDGGSERGVKITKTANGGLIYMDNASGVLNVTTGTTLRNCEFAVYDDGNNSRGGAIYMTNGTLNVDAGLFSNLHAYQGGAICVTGGTLNITGTEESTQFEDCRSERQDGGAIYYNKGQDLLIDGGTDKKHPGIIFTRCVAAYTNGTGDGSDGGAIFATSNYTNTVTVKGCSFIECSARTGNGSSTAGYGGGGICAYHVKGLTVEACTFESCDTLCGGGAVVAMVKYTETVNNETVTIKNCSFDQCNCKGQAGALGVYQDDNTAANSATKLSIIDCSFTGCSSGTNNGSGGAIQCYLPCMVFSGSSFTDCWAGKEGGAVNNYFGGSYTAVWNKSFMTVENCDFTRCRAEDRYDTTAPQHYGGGINTKAKLVTVTGSTFTDCVSTLREGGALHIGGQGGGSKATITGSTFKNCSAKNGGGALLSSHETLEITNCYFYGCSSSASNGGAVYHYKNSRGDSTQNTTSITNCTFSSYSDPDDSTASTAGCSAAQNGGAIWTRAGTVSVTNCTITGCAANKGGAVYLSKEKVSSQSGTITDGTISGCEAVYGSAVYVENKATFSGSLTVSDNTVSDINSGAIHGGTLYFEGNVIVEDNTCSADSTDDHDVLMQNNNVTTIYTTETGLGEMANIGVYVPDSQLNNRGIEGKAFGTYKNNAYLDAFFNDRDSELYGYQMAENDANIYWGIYVCKITDAGGKTLTRPNGRPAVYQSLSAALSEFLSVTDPSITDPSINKNTAVYIKMLVESYIVKSTSEISNFPNADVTLTTASKSDEEHAYRGAEGTVCTISRTSGTTQLFKLEDNAEATFQLEDITLDGRNNKSTETGNRRLIEVKSGNLVINGGTTLQYGAASNGGAIEAAAAANVTINGVCDANTKEPTVRFINCAGTGTNKPNGGAIRAYNLTITNDSNVRGEFGTAFINCSAYNGGAITSLGSSMEIDGVLFDACQTQSAGGAVYHNYSADNSTTTVKNCSFENCQTNGNNWAHGGAIEAKTESLLLEDCSFKNCQATSDGGAVYHGLVDGNNKPSGSRVKTEIKNTTFDGCSTIGTNSSYNFGGSVYTQAKTVSLTGGSFTDSTAYNHGGALYCQSDDGSSQATISGTSFTRCSVTHNDGCGGAIYSRGKTLTLQDSGEATAAKATTISACTAPGYSGAIYMEKDSSVLNITGNTLISGCYANQGGAIYLKSGVTMNLTGSPEFTRNGYTTQNGSVVNAEKGACIYLEQGSRINLSDSPKFSWNILPNKERITNGSILDYVRQDLYLAGYSGQEATSIHVNGELTGDTIWVWPEQNPHRLANKQFAKISLAGGVTLSEDELADTLSHFRNALSDSVTGCSAGEYLAGVKIGDDSENVYWDKMYVINFKKKDNKGVSVPDAEFTLYKDAACTNQVARATSADGENVTDIQGNLLTKGTVEFTSIQIGAYYMKETKVPTSFKENSTRYLVLVGTPYLSRNDANKSLWEGDGPLNVDNAETLVAQHTTDANKYYGVFPLNENGKADLKANLASSTMGIVNIRNDYQVAFMKVDGAGKALPGAAFTIYTAILDSSGQPETFADGYPKLIRWSRDGENYPAPVVSADGTAHYRDVNNDTLPKGLVYFRELPLGTYYLLETGYPERNGDGRRTYYAESDRVFRLTIEESSGEDKISVTLKEWKPATENGEASYEELPKPGGYYVVSNQEVVCKLTDGSDNLLYTQGHEVWEKDYEDGPAARLFPAIYPTLEEGFHDAQTRTFVDANGETASVSSLKLKALKDFTLSESVTYSNTERDITFTTAETSVSKDRYIFSTTRTTDTARALISRGYSESTSENANAGALITLDSGANMTLQNIRLNGQKSSRSGRAVHVMGESSLTILNNTRIENFAQRAAQSSTDSNHVRGGAILLDDGTSLTINGGYNKTAIFAGNAVERTEGSTGADGGAIAVGANCTLDIKNAQFTGNSATAVAKNEGNGGAVSISEKNGDVGAKIETTVFQNNSASHQGGAVAVLSKQSSPSVLTITGGTFTGNTASLGSAVYAENYAEMTVTDASITGNRATADNGGAINVGGDQARLYFGGHPTVFDNFGASGTAQQKNLVLSEDSNAVIRTTENGLIGGLIGVYVTDGDSDAKQFKAHGLHGSPFGTFDDQGKLHPEAFRNDRVLALYGTKKDGDDTTIYWNDVICKLTDTNDNLLYQDIQLDVNGKKKTYQSPAVYPAIQQGFDAAQGTLYVKNDTYTANERKLKMLKDAELTESIQYSGGKEVIFTTAETTERQGDYFVFSTQREDTKALLTRAFKGDSMVSVSGKNLTLTDITLDGAKGTYTVETNGGIAHVQRGGKLTIQSGAVLQNAATSGSGGAVYVETGGTVTVSGGTITNNQSTKDGAGIYLAEGSLMNISGNPSFNNNVSDTALSQGAMNGADEYSQARQDIYIAGYAHQNADDTSASSLNVDGNITSGEGSIWVWAAKSPRYLPMGQFARYDQRKVTDPEMSFKAFRNAQENEVTGASQMYLFGVPKDDTTGNYVIWYGGSRPVILRKMGASGSSYIPLHDEREPVSERVSFTVYSNLSGTIAKDEAGNTLENLPLGKNGVFYVGTLSYGKYYIKENGAPEGYTETTHYFAIEIREDGFYDLGTQTVQPGTAFKESTQDAHRLPSP